MGDSFSFLKPYLRGWPIILASMILGYFIASKYLNYVTPMYESTAKLRLADFGEGVPNSNLFKDLDVFATTQKINTEIEVIKSNILLNKVLDSLELEIQIFRVGKLKIQELYKDSPIHISSIFFNEKDKDKAFQLRVIEDYQIQIFDGERMLFKGVLGDTVSIGNSKIVVELNNNLVKSKHDIKIPDEYQFVFNSRQKLLGNLIKNLDVSAVDKDVAIVRINYKSPHPEKAAIVPNVLSELYIQDFIETKYSAANITVGFLDDRIGEVSKQLVDIENQILGYRNIKKITNLSQETETDLRKISQMKIQLTNLKMSLEAISDLEKYVNDGKENFLDLAPNFEAFTDLLSTEMVKKIKQLQADKKDLLSKYTENDTRVKLVDQKIDDLKKYLLESIKNTRNNLAIKYKRLEEDVEQAEKVFVEVPEKEKILTILNREFNIYQQSYNFLNEKKIEAEIAKAAKIAFHRVITPAHVTKEPVSPNRSIIKIVTTILFMMAALGFIFIVHSLKAKVNNIHAIQSVTMIPVISEIPKLINKQQEQSFFLELLARWEVKNLLPTNGITCLSAFKLSEGSSYLGKNLMDCFEYQNRKVLFVDFNSIVYPHIDRSIFEKQLNEYISVINIDIDQFKKYSNAKLNDWLLEMSKKYDQTIILNQEFGNQFSLSAMNAATLNVVSIDARLTPLKKIIELDLMKNEFDIQYMNLALNRAFYSPSIFREIFQWGSFTIRKINFF